MDFFAAQEAAKKRTAWAIVLFVAGVVATAFAMYLVVMYAIVFNSQDKFFPGRELVSIEEIGWVPFQQIMENPALFL